MTGKGNGGVLKSRGETPTIEESEKHLPKGKKKPSNKGQKAWSALFTNQIRTGQIGNAPEQMEISSLSRR